MIECWIQRCRQLLQDMPQERVQAAWTFDELQAWRKEIVAILSELDGMPAVLQRVTPDVRDAYKETMIAVGTLSEEVRAQVCVLVPLLDLPLETFMRLPRSVLRVAYELQRSDLTRVGISREYASHPLQEKAETMIGTAPFILSFNNDHTHMTPENAGAFIHELEKVLASSPGSLFESKVYSAISSKFLRLSGI